ncbi:hypothetical protein [Paraburkholderia humisilvae]|uniref:Uncharacterized protein n=1 Tax=Paraburkholderia humisilvae TaxID=627669 RepID=A0A6J5E6K2_9BURK|nr:hypothetical protein [Paraburkholderia humisilvae]CAB3760966.1 hypothetical protein LMG29542_03972 [Paraburkholderia humisilvae]
MQWHQLLKQGHLDVDGRRYDLTHLLAGVVQFTIPGTGKYPLLPVSMRVEYTSHCVSYGPLGNGETFDFTSLSASRVRSSRRRTRILF